MAAFLCLPKEPEIQIGRYLILFGLGFSMQGLKLHKSVMETFLLSYKAVTYLYINPILLSK